MTAEYLVRFSANRLVVREWCVKNFPTDGLSFYSGWDNDRGRKMWRWRFNLQDKNELLLNREADAAWFLLRWS